MPSITTRCDTPRHTGCAVSGALSVTTSIEGAYSLVHGPDGCSHQFVSLFHTLSMDQGLIAFPRVVSSRLSEREVIFGGLPALSCALDRVLSKKPSLVCIITSCIAETIGDDILAVLPQNTPVPIVPIPVGGFIGGGFEAGVTEALLRLGACIPDTAPTGGVAVIGEKNLEYEADTQFIELKRLLSLIGVKVTVRYVRNMPSDGFLNVAGSRLLIQRDTSVSKVGEYLSLRFGTPVISSFPAGMKSTLDFLREAAGHLGIDPENAIRTEGESQREIISAFSDLAGREGRIVAHGEEALRFGSDLAKSARIVECEGGTPLPVTDPLPTGTAGVRRTLSRWRRALV